MDLLVKTCLALGSPDKKRTAPQPVVEGPGRRLARKTSTGDSLLLKQEPESAADVSATTPSIPKRGRPRKQSAVSSVAQGSVMQAGPSCSPGQSQTDHTTSRLARTTEADAEAAETIRNLAEKLRTTSIVLRKAQAGSLSPSQSVTYKPCRPWLSRDIAQGGFACQHLPQWVQSLLFPNTCDVDITNCGFSLSHQLLSLVGLPEFIQEEFAPELQLL